MAFNHKRVDLWFPDFGFKRSLLSLLREVSFFTGRGAPENWRDQVLFLRSKWGSKDFFKLKRGDHLYFLKK